MEKKKKKRVQIPTLAFATAKRPFFIIDRSYRAGISIAGHLPEV